MINKYIVLLMLFLISNISYANQTNNITDSLGSFLLFPFLFILMYILLIRPQTKKANDHKTLLNNLKINDEVVTQSGFLGKIKKILDQFIILSLNDTTDIIIKKDAISTILPKNSIKQIK